MAILHWKTRTSCDNVLFQSFKLKYCNPGNVIFPSAETSDNPRGVASIRLRVLWCRIHQCPILENPPLVPHTGKLIEALAPNNWELWGLVLGLGACWQSSPGGKVRSLQDMVFIFGGYIHSWGQALSGDLHTDHHVTLTLAPDDLHMLCFYVQESSLLK